jgi:hypothetical protein
MKASKLGPHTSARVWVLVALEAAKHLIPIIQRELKKRWKNRNNNKEKNQ